MTTAFSLSPLFRSTVGFDRLNDLFESLAGEESVPNYPPYNIEKHGEDQYGITMAVAGFTEEDLNITVERDRLTVTGRNQASATETEFLYRGIAARPFERVFRLADHMKVMGADMKNGLLHIRLVREIPEAQKPRTIKIGAEQKALEHAPEGKRKAA